MHIRYSRKSDLESIENLVLKCFGPRPGYGVTDNLQGRYLVAIKDDKIVAMSGLSSKTTYANGVEVDWTCTDPAYRNTGIMKELFDRLVASTDENIYCSCLRVGNNEYVNLHKHMQMFGFEKIMDSIKHYAKGVLCFDCPWCHSDCECYEDLYLRKKLD